MRSRYQRIWPCFFFGFIIYFLMLLVKYQFHYSKWISELYHSVLEIFLLQVLGVREWSTNHGAVWYLSVLVISSFLLWLLLEHFQKICIHFLLPILIIVICTIFEVKYGSMIVPWDATCGIIKNPSFYRGFCDMSLGVEIYYISSVLQEKINFNTIIYKFALVALFSFCIVITCFTTSPIYIIPLFTFVVILGWCTRWKNVNESKIVRNLSAISLALYINHPLFVDTHIFINVPHTFIRTIIYIICVTAYSEISYLVVKRISGLISEKLGHHNEL